MCVEPTRELKKLKDEGDDHIDQSLLEPVEQSNRI